MFEKNSNFDLFHRLYPHSFSEGMLIHHVRAELQRRANAGDDEARQLLLIHDNEFQDTDPLVHHQHLLIHKQTKIKITFKLRIS